MFDYRLWRFVSVVLDSSSLGWGNCVQYQVLGVFREIVGEKLCQRLSWGRQRNQLKLRSLVHEVEYKDAGKYRSDLRRKISFFWKYAHSGLVLKRWQAMFCRKLVFFSIRDRKYKTNGTVFWCVLIITFFQTRNYDTHLPFRRKNNFVCDKIEIQARGFGNNSPGF